MARRKKILIDKPASPEPNDRPRSLEDFPVEIIYQIFTHYICEHPASRGASLLLCKISSRLRHTAISLPYIWKHLHIDTEKCPKNSASLISMCDLWIERSHPLPFSISVSVDSVSNSPLANSLIHTFSSKIQTLSIDLPLSWEGLICFTEETQSINFQALDTLVLNIYTRLHMPSHMPNLRRLRICRVSEPIYTTPWEQLTHLDITQDIMFSQFLQLLSTCLSLVDGGFAINHASISMGDLALNPVPILLQLNRLVLRNVPSSELEILPFRSLVAVEEFGLISLRASSEIFGNNIPICGTVRQLTFSMRPPKSLPPIQLLQKFELLTSLTLCCALSTKRMDAFLRTLATTPLLPHLTSLNLCLRAVNGFDLGLYKAFISGRWSAGPSSVNTRLTKCSLNFVVSPGGSQAERTLYKTMVLRLHKLLKPLVDNGLKFSTDILDNFPSFAWSPF